jgi:putative transposon-encoded protein
MEIQELRFNGYAFVEKTAKNGGNSARVFVPKSWAGKKVVAVLLETIED